MTSGSGTTAINLTLDTVNPDVGTFSVLTVNGKGLVTSARALVASDINSLGISYLPISGGTLTGSLVVDGTTTFNNNVTATNINATSDLKAGDSVLGGGYLDLYDNNTPSVQFFSTAGTAYQGYIQYAPPALSTNSYINEVENFIFSVGQSQLEVIYFNQNGIVIAGKANTNTYNAGLIFPDGTKQTTAYTTPSDASLKTNVVSLANSLTTINNLMPISYNYLANACANVGLNLPNSVMNTTQNGFVAQDLMNIIPNAVFDNGKYKEVDMIEIIPFLVGAIQTLSAQNANMANTIISLSNTITTLQAKMN